MLNELQKKSAQAIVNIFETGRVLGEYGQVTVLRGDTGHLTYGRAQTTLASGNLALLIDAYCRAGDARCRDELEPFLPALRDRDTALDSDFALHAVLRRAGDDPAMRREQDAFFDRVYWAPAIRSAEYIGAETALGTSVVYDGRIHGSWHAIRDRTIDRFGRLDQLGEEDWFARYVDTRRDWLANHANELLRKTVYRMDAYRQLMDEERWSLALPFTVRGRVVDETSLDGGAEPAPGNWAGDKSDRVLRLADPYMRGDDVRAMQQALAGAGMEIAVDGVFGPGTESAVRAFQERNGLASDGIAGPATLSALLP